MDKTRPFKLPEILDCYALPSYGQHTNQANAQSRKGGLVVLNIKKLRANDGLSEAAESC